MASTSLQTLEPIVKISDTIVRILGQNPGKFTLQGTNTYLIGTQSPYLLLDTGEGKPAYLPLLASALGKDGVISQVVISHQHKDHWGGLAGVLGLLKERGAPRPTVWKWRNVAYDQEIVGSLKEGTYKVSDDGKALGSLAEGQTLQATGCTLQVVYTPGHTEDSICLVACDGSIFTADTVLGQSTAVFTDLSTYLSSLRHLASLRPLTLYPGHGPIVSDGTGAIETYIAHRQQREDQILQVLQQEKKEGARMPGEWGKEGHIRGWSVEEIVQEIYPDVGFILQNAAGRGVDLHLQKLLVEGKVCRTDVAGGAEWTVK